MDNPKVRKVTFTGSTMTGTAIQKAAAGNNRGVTMVLGGWHSLRELDLKLILAFGTVSQLGFMAVLVGIGDANVAMAGIAMLVAHALFKASLFMVVGIIDHSTGTRDVRKLARLGHRLPGLAITAAVAGASMAGIPVTLGFVGKETAFASVWETGAFVSWQAHAVDIILLVGSIIEGPQIGWTTPSSG